MKYVVKRRRMGVWVMWGVWNVEANTWTDITFMEKVDAEEYIKTMK